MEKQTITIDGIPQEWGRVMMGKDKNRPMYRVLIDGKWKPVTRELVPREVIEVFDGVQINVEEQKSHPTVDELKMVQDVIKEKDDIQEQDVNEFGMDDTVPEIDDTAYIQELEQKSIDNASLHDLCEALYKRFGLYTCYLKREPKDTDVHPVTGALMNNFTLGQTRQQYFTAVRMKTNYDPTVMRGILKSRENVHFDIQAHKAEHPERFAPESIEMPTEDNPYADKKMTMEEWRKRREQANKPIMASQRGRFDDGSDPDELYAEPPINGRTIIRDYPTSPIAEKRLAEKKARREQYGY